MDDTVAGSDHVYHNVGANPGKGLDAGLMSCCKKIRSLRRAPFAIAAALGTVACMEPASTAPLDRRPCVRSRPGAILCIAVTTVPHRHDIIGRDVRLPYAPSELLIPA